MKSIHTFLNDFPTNATSWAQATDEIMSVARAIRNHYNEEVIFAGEGDKDYVEAADFKNATSAAQFNKRGHDFINKYWDLIGDDGRICVSNYFGWFSAEK